MLPMVKCRDLPCGGLVRGCQATYVKFKMGGTTEITDNFVPVDVWFVGFMFFGGS
jgi:hypothetical protein